MNLIDYQGGMAYGAWCKLLLVNTADLFEVAPLVALVRCRMHAGCPHTNGHAPRGTRHPFYLDGGGRLAPHLRRA